MPLINVSRNVLLAQRAKQANGFFERMRGLLGKPPLVAGEALIIPSICPQIHTFFLGYTIDAIFINPSGVVVGLETVKPWRWSRIYPKANRVIETTQGTIKRSETQVGHIIEDRA